MLFLFVVPQSNAYVIERLGVYKTTWDAGLRFCIPFIDRVARRISLKEQVADFLPQNIITKDNCMVRVDTVVFFKVVDPKLFTYGIMDPINAIANISATTLRNYIGNLSLEETMTSRDEINNHMRQVLDDATDPWGIKINRVEIKEVTPPDDVREAMEKQIKAEREKRSTILTAEARKQADILQAEGQKEAMILTAVGKKEAQILEAEADKAAKILRAEAEKQQRILKSEGEAVAIKKVQEARAQGIMAVSNSNPTEKYVELQKLETMAKVASGQATKILIPAEMQGIANLAVGIKEMVTEKSDAKNALGDKEVSENDY